MEKWLVTHISDSNICLRYNSKSTMAPKLLTWDLYMNFSYTIAGVVNGDQLIFI